MQGVGRALGAPPTGPTWPALLGFRHGGYGGLARPPGGVGGGVSGRVLEGGAGAESGAGAGALVVAPPAPLAAVKQLVAMGFPEAVVRRVSAVLSLKHS